MPDISVGEAMRRIRRRLDEWDTPEKTGVVFGPAADDEAATLERAIEAGAATRTDGARLAEIHLYLGTLHYYRSLSFPNEPVSLPEMARAIVYLDPVERDLRALPALLASFIGPAADIVQRVRMAGMFMRTAGSASADPVLADAAVLLVAGAVRRASRRHPLWCSLLKTLGQAHMVRYDRSADPVDLDHAIAQWQEAVAAAQRQAPDEEAQIWDFLCIACRRRYEHQGIPDDLDRAVEAGEGAVAAVHGDELRKAAYRNGLGLAYRMRYERTGDAADLERAITCADQAVTGTPRADPHSAGILFNQGVAYRRRYARYGEPADLDQAIRIGEQVNRLAPAGHGSLPANLSSLGHSYLDRYQRGGNKADLDLAVKVHEAAIAAVGEDGPGGSRYLTGLAGALLVRHRRGGDVADLERAMRVAGQAVDAGRGERDSRAAREVTGHAYLERYLALGYPDDLDRGIEFMENAAPDGPGSEAMGGWWPQLCVGYTNRYDRLGNLADLERAIEVGEAAVAEVPGDRPDLGGFLSSLGQAYRARYERLENPRDLSRAIDLYEQALAGAPEGHFNRATLQAYLGGLHVVRYERGGDSVDLERAGDLFGQALAATPTGDSEWAFRLENLARISGLRYEAGGTDADLGQAIELGEQALAAMPLDNPSRAVALSNLTVGYRRRLLAAEGGVSSAKLAWLVEQAAIASAAAPADRVRCGDSVGSLALAMGESATAVSLLDAAVGMLPSVPPRDGGWADQEHRIGRHPGLVGTAIAAHCALGDPAGAVGIAELGRGILLARRMDSRTDLTELADAEPELAARFRQARDALAAAGIRRSGVPGLAADQRRLWAEHDELLGRIRARPRFARFLLPPEVTGLRSAAEGGGVVLVNADRERSDAIIVTADADPVAVALPELDRQDVLASVSALLLATHATGMVAQLRSQRILGDILAWLWDTITGPVLDAWPPSVPPQVWWMPAGLLGLLPLHAAGRPGQPGALDRVTSSYTPTLRVLAETRRQAASVVPRRQLNVALRHVPGLPDLPGSAAEAEDLYRRHPDTPPLRDRDATTARVLAALPDATWAHFACHASADLAAPSQSGLRLYDGTLTIPDISGLHMPQAELAYLSACSTANQGLQAVDESIHLASAFQIAGFRHVIASLWPVDDVIAATVARSFYQRMDIPAAASGIPVADRAAGVLRQVTLDLRADHPDRPDLWASLIHSGP